MQFGKFFLQEAIFEPKSDVEFLSIEFVLYPEVIIFLFNSLSFVKIPSDYWIRLLVRLVQLYVF